MKKVATLLVSYILATSKEFLQQISMPKIGKMHFFNKHYLSWTNKSLCEKTRSEIFTKNMLERINVMSRDIENVIFDNIVMETRKITTQFQKISTINVQAVAINVTIFEKHKFKATSLLDI